MGSKNQKKKKIKLKTSEGGLSGMEKMSITYSYQEPEDVCKWGKVIGEAPQRGMFSKA